ncbi:hypothetical protein ACQY0O_001657 [Thecaphora frezii]
MQDGTHGAGAPNPNSTSCEGYRAVASAPFNGPVAESYPAGLDTSRDAGSRVSSAPSSSSTPQRETSEGARYMVTAAHGAQGVESNHRRPQTQSDWVKLPSVSHGLPFFAGVQPPEPLFSLVVRQQPKRGLAIGSSQMALRTARSVPLDPPPVCELLMNRSGDEHALSLPEVFVRAQLVCSEAPYDEVLPDVRRNEALVGDTLQSPFNSRIESKEDQSFFVFKELGVRNKGIYRIRFDLFDRVGLSIRRMASVYTDVFEVHERRKHPGLTASTSLMDALVDRGMKYKLRKPVEPKMAGKKRKLDLNEGCPGEAQPRCGRMGEPSSRTPLRSNPADVVWPWRQNGYDHPSGYTYAQDGWRQPEARPMQAVAPSREVIERPRPMVPRWIHEPMARRGAFEPNPSRDTNYPGFAGATDPARERLGRPMYDEREAADETRTATSMDELRPVRPGLPERTSSSSLSGSSLSTHRASSSQTTPITPGSRTQTTEETGESPSTIANGTTKLPSIAHLYDSAQIGSAAAFQRPARSSHSPSWLPSPSDLLKNRRSSESRFPGRPF